jgi:nucleotide-binding universal stress UspA family protein
MENATTKTSTGSRVLVPHDGSEMSDKALNKAIEFATALKSEMIILHIVDNRFIPPSATLGFISEQSTLEDAKAQLVKILKVGAELLGRELLNKSLVALGNFANIIGIRSVRVHNTAMQCNPMDKTSFICVNGYEMACF